MKLFMDTSNKKFILAIINENNEIADFFIEDTNNNVVKNSVFLMKKFLNKNKLEINEINEYMITIGPGSFTGVKVALNILKSINLVNEIKKIYVINTFDLLKEKGKKYTAIRFGKSKFYLKNTSISFSKVKVVTSLDSFKEKDYIIDYDNFTKDKLKLKIDNNDFKLLDNLDKVNIDYLTNF